VVGENVVGIDCKAVINKGKISKAPELDRRIETYLRYYDGYGAIIVQMNVEDTRNGVAQYVVDKYGDKAIIELKWGQGAKDIGGEIQVTDIEYAKFLKDRAMWGIQIHMIQLFRQRARMDPSRALPGTVG
jgi:hypothetical protein